jgi:hypothetical protein
MLITFFDITGIIHFEFIPQGQRANQTYYVEIMKWLHDAVHIKFLSFGLTTGFSIMTVLQLQRFPVSMRFLAPVTLI